MHIQLKRSAALAVVALIACSSKTDTSVGTPTQDVTEFNGTFTLQGTVMNAVTGDHLGGGDLKLYLIQGAEVRSPARLVTTAGDPLEGQYAFTGIPADYYAGNKTYQLVVKKTGYLDFYADVTFAIKRDTSDRPVLDAVYNVIGNIYLFPVGTPAPDQTFTVRWNGKPVPNATVYLDPTGGNTVATDTSHVLAQSSGYIPALSGTTDASGHVTFAGTSLALGARYHWTVAPVVFEGVQLHLATDGDLISGLDSIQQVVDLTDLTPDATAYGLYVAEISNAAPSAVDPTGRLAITFSRPVVVHAPATGANFAATAAGITLQSPPVSYQLSADGLTLTLTPATVGAPSTTETVTVTYGDGSTFLSLKDDPNTSFKVFDLVDRAGNKISPTVTLVVAP